MNQPFYYTRLFQLWLVLLLYLPVPEKLPAQGSVLLVGGGSEDANTWSDRPFSWMVSQADSGKIINIDVDAATPWYASYFRWLGADPASHHLQIASRTAANDSAVYRELISASGIFIEGGDQWDYIETWKNTLVSQALQEIFDRGGVIGGTSAGLAVLGEVVFDARFGTADPKNVAYDPYNSRVSFTDDFLMVLPGILTDSHFQARGRLGRLIPMLARRIVDYNQPNLTAIGVDEEMALGIDQKGLATAFGNSSVTILYAGAGSQINCRPGIPVSFTSIGCDILLHEAVYDLNTKTLIDSGIYLKAARPAQIQPIPAETILLEGSMEETADKGEIRISGLTGNPENWWQNGLQAVPGTSQLPGAVLIPKLWHEADFYPNRISGGLLGAALHPGFFAIFLDDSSRVTVTEDGKLSTEGICYLLESPDARFTGKNQFGIPGMIGGKIQVLADGDRFDLLSGQAALAIPQNVQPKPAGFRLNHCAPNPFNNSFVIEFELPEPGQIEIAVFNSIGQKIQRVMPSYFQAGSNRLFYPADNLSSGVYFLRLSFKEQSRMFKLVHLK